MMMMNATELHARLFKSRGAGKSLRGGCFASDSRRRRTINTLCISKMKRAEGLSKKRDAIPLQTYRADASVLQKLANLPKLLSGLLSDDLVWQLEATTHLRKLLSVERHNMPIIDEVVATGAVPRLVQFLSFHQSPLLQFEAAWALTNITSGTSEQTRIVIEAGAVPFFVQLLGSSNDEVRDQVTTTRKEQKNPFFHMFHFFMFNHQKLRSVV